VNSKGEYICPECALVAAEFEKRKNNPNKKSGIVNMAFGLKGEFVKGGDG